MRKFLIATLTSIISFLVTNAQQAPKLTETSIVKDTLGNNIPFPIWSQLLPTGRFKIKPEDPKDEKTAFIMTRLSDEEFEKKIAALPKPVESKYFKTGSAFSHFKTRDINGKKINTKDLLGKTIVLNFWFINCPPCRRELPELNTLAQTYQSDSTIEFLAIALDRDEDIKEFLKLNPFGYKMIGDGKYIANQYNLNSYPTNVIVDPKGKIYFHSSGLGANTVYWLKKSIEELKNTSVVSTE
jgi:thiol-disulfide isomerase/thioredoxin